MNPSGALIFLVNFALEIYAFILLTRFLLQAVKADFYNPLSQFIVKATDPIAKPLRKIIPSKGSFDTSTLLLFVLLVIVKIAVLFQLSYGALPSATQLLLGGTLAAFILILKFFTWTIFISIILSWINPDPYNPVGQLLNQLTEPLLGPVRKLLPPMGGLDFSPMLVLLLLYALQIFLGGA